MLCRLKQYQLYNRLSKNGNKVFNVNKNKMQRFVNHLKANMPVYKLRQFIGFHSVLNVFQ